MGTFQARYICRMGKFSSQWKHDNINFTFCADGFFQMIGKYMWLSNFYRSFHIFIVLLLLLIMCGDIKVNPGPDNNKNLVFSFSNMQSLYANKSDLKLSELQIMANDWHIDVLAVTETWLDSNIPDALVSITGYQKPI